MITQITDRERELAAERDRYQEAADRMAAAHKVERDALAAENERLKNLISGAGGYSECAIKAQEEIVKLREAARMGLSTLEGWRNYDEWVWPETALEQSKRNTKESITALKEALGEKQSKSHSNNKVNLGEK